MADLRIVDAPEIPTENITGEEKLPTGGSGNYSISLDSLADYTKTKKDLADNTSVDTKVNGVRQELESHVEDLLNPHQVTKGQIGLGNVDNTADADKPVSNSTQSAIISAVTPKADKTYVDTQLALKANKVDVYTKQESSDLVDNSISTALTPVNDSLGLAKRGIANRYDSTLTYNSGERVVLVNGDIVKSTIDGNVNDPNVDMTGWFNPEAEQQKVNSKIRKTPYDFGAKGGDNDDTLAVKACIESGYFLIDDVYQINPILVQDLNLDGKFAPSGKLSVKNSTNQDSITFLRCSGEIHGINVDEVYSAGSYVTVYANWCKSLNIHKPKIQNGKIIGLALANSTNCHVYDGIGIAETSQAWYLLSCINSSMNKCYLKNNGNGFFILGKGYKSGTNPRMEIDEQTSLGMSFNHCYAEVGGVGYDINGAVGATINRSVVDQNFADTLAAGFQVKQSTNIPEETKRLTQKNTIIGCVAIKCSRGYVTQNGEDILFKDNFVFGSKHNAVALNDTPRVTIDGLYCYDLFQKNVSSPSVDAGAVASIVRAKNPSPHCIVKNVRLYQSVLPEDITQINLFDFDGESSSIDDVMINTSSVVNSNSGKFNSFCRNSGLNFTYGSQLKVGLDTNYTKIIDDQTSSAIYPLVFSKQIDLTTASTGTEYFDGVPERGLIVGKVRFHVIGTPTNTKLAVGSQSSVAGVLGLTDVVAGVNTYTPTSQVVVSSQALAIRREITGTASGRVIVQMRGISAN